MTLRIDYRLYETRSAPFGEMVRELLETYRPTATPVRFVFMGNPHDNEQYLDHLSLIHQEMHRRFAERAPVVSYVVQAPCGAGLLLEVHEVCVPADAVVCYKKLDGLSYVTVEDGFVKRLFVAGLQGDVRGQRFDEQAEFVFAKLGALMSLEQMPLHTIVRQWNYIEQITRFDDSGRQHYQIFNDARSRFYHTEGETWSQGYPAATGIGTQAGGVLVGLDAVQGVSGETSLEVYKIDNPLQVAAHNYSQEVLLGSEDLALKQKTTPKFERAKTVADAHEGMVYVSGTAAIRGEYSLNCAAVAEQTVMTLENIEYLISAANLCRFRASAREKARLTHLRVYLKHSEDRGVVQEILRERYPRLPVLYVVADVCREELLIEMEGAAYFDR